MVSSQIVSPLLDWFRRHARDLPWRRTTDPYAIWVSEIMLQQTQVKTVIPYFERWMRALPNVEALAKARAQKLHKLWEGLGYYTRVRNMQRAAKLICERHQGRVPNRAEDLLRLPGIGRYTAGAICSIAFNQAVPILDGNVIRVLSRVYCLAGDPRERKVNARFWAIAEELVQAAANQVRGSGTETLRMPRGKGAGNASAFNQAIMELGALICTPRNPRCGVCPLKKCCLACRQGRVAKFPHRVQRAQPVSRRFTAFIIEHKGRTLVRQRPAGVVNAHLWELPNVETSNGQATVKQAARLAIGATAEKFEPFCVIRHSITRYRMALEVFKATLTPGQQAADHPGWRWVPRHALGRLPFASAHRKVVSRLSSRRLD